MALAGRDVDQARDLAAGRDPVDLTVVRLDGIEDPVDRDHGVPRPVGFEVVLLWIRNRIGLDELAQVRDLCDRSVRVHAVDAVARSHEPVRAAGARDQRIERSVDELHIGDPADQTAESRARLTGRQAVRHGRAVPVAVDLRDPRSEVAAVRADRVDNLVTVMEAGLEAPRASFRDIEVPVGAERQPTRVVQPRREDRCRCCVRPFRCAGRNDDQANATSTTRNLAIPGSFLA